MCAISVGTHVKILFFVHDRPMDRPVGGLTTKKSVDLTEFQIKLMKNYFPTQDPTSATQQ